MKGRLLALPTLLLVLAGVGQVTRTLFAGHGRVSVREGELAEEMLPRIKELRDLGERIKTHWVNIATESGERHHIGLYVLESGAFDEAVWRLAQRAGTNGIAATAR